eukprot:gb/GEZJ01002792.1/.p3 GENE.gb/GEZJ01002792.1/~~gb/GEZJ01002792.1/.p3  ORF type:complete len:141 (-),score=18.24 gb/GEZJ01002792.1/:87-509(-)
MDTLLYNDNEDWNKHESKFVEIVGEQATFDKKISEKEKVSKLFRSLPISFAPLAMKSNLTDSGFDSIFNAVEAEVVRRKNPNDLQQASSDTPPTPFKLPIANKTMKRGRQWSGRRNKSSSNRGCDEKNCYYCRRRGHYAQ